MIGGGPAGYTAALYAARANLEPLVIEGFNWGGQLMITSDVENYPGYADGIMGPAMMQDFRRQAERFGDDVRDRRRDPRRLLAAPVPGLGRRRRVPRGLRDRRDGRDARASSGSSRSSCSRAAASRTARPATPRSSATRSSSSWAAATRRWRRRSSSRRFASKVYLVHRREEFRASPIMVDRARANEKIELVLNKVVDEVLGRRQGHGRPPGGHGDRRGEHARGRRALRRDRPRPEHRALPRPARPRAGHRLPRDAPGVDRDERPRRLRGRRRAGPRLSPGRHRRRLGLRGRARRGAVAERAAPRGAVGVGRRLAG